MTYKLKLEKKKEKEVIYQVQRAYDDLDDEAYLKYGSKYSELDKKSQKKIAKEVVELYPHTHKAY
jgi:hypothetical protein